MYLHHGKNLKILFQKKLIKYPGGHQLGKDPEQDPPVDLPQGMFLEDQPAGTYDAGDNDDDGEWKRNIEIGISKKTKHQPQQPPHPQGMHADLQDQVTQKGEDYCQKIAQHKCGQHYRYGRLVLKDKKPPEIKSHRGYIGYDPVVLGTQPDGFDKVQLF